MHIIPGPDTSDKVIHNIYPEGIPVNPAMMNPNIGGFLGKKCKHIYEYVYADICPDCGKDTHETDWKFQHELHREWIESGKAELQGWWSI